MWPPLLLAVLLLSLAHSTPVKSELEYLHDYFESLYDDGLNISTTEKIFDEESTRLGVPLQEHAKACKEPTLIYMHVFGGGSKRGESSIYQKIRGIPSEDLLTDANFSHFNTTAEIIDRIKKDTPKLFDVLNEEFHRYMSKLDIDAKNFILQAGEQVVESALKTLSLVAGSDEFVDRRKKDAAMIDKQIVAYKALSQSAKDSIDRVFCAQTILRMLEKKCGDFSMWLTAIKETYQGHSTLEGERSVRKLSYC